MCVGFLYSNLVQAGPEIVCPNPLFEFGDLSNHEKIRHVFRLENPGDEPLRIGVIKTACGCTSAEVTDETIPPGGATDLVVVFDLNRRYGHQDKWVNIASNASDTPNYQVRLKGVAIADINAAPANLFEKSIEPGVAIHRTVRISAVEGKTFVIRDVKSTTQQVRFELELIEKGRVYDLHVVIPPQKEEKDFYDNILVMTDYKMLPYFSIQVRGRIIRPLQVTPDPITLSRPAEGMTVTRYMTVRPGSVEEFKIVSATWPDPDAVVEILPPSKFGTRIRISNVTVDDALEGKELVIQTDVEKARELRVPITLMK